MLYMHKSFGKITSLNLFLVVFITHYVILNPVRAQLTCSGCSCAITSNQLNLTCTTSTSANTFISGLGSNGCSSQSTITAAYMANNAISQAPLTASMFNCMAASLLTLDLSHNQITTLSNYTFDNMTSLVTLDLSYNNISSIPVYLFADLNVNRRILTKLEYLYLQNNKIVSLDPWFFYLQSIDTISIANNQISTFTNNLRFYMTNGVIDPALIQSISFDLSGNKIAHFDDYLLSIYGICTKLNLTFFLQFMYQTNLSSNPLYCDCSRSYSMVTMVYQLKQASALNTQNPIFTTSLCKNVTNPSYFGYSAIDFYSANPTLSTCKSSNYTCPASLLVNSVNVSVLAQVGLPEYDLKVSSTPTAFYAGYICGIIIAFLGALILFCLLMYLICPIEILACLFTLCPCLFSWCPCKSGYRREKEYDIFISFNPSNHKWVLNKLIPFIEKHKLAENYVLHYNEENPTDVYSPVVEKLLDNSTIILVVLSDAYLMHEWQNEKFRDHIRHLVSSDRACRLVCVQLHDVSDEEVEQYFRESVQIPQFVAIEDDEILFWRKLHYHLYLNNKPKRSIYIAPESPLDYDRPVLQLDGVRDDKENSNVRVVRDTSARADSSRDGVRLTQATPLISMVNSKSNHQPETDRSDSPSSDVYEASHRNQNHLIKNESRESSRGNLKSVGFQDRRAMEQQLIVSAGEGRSGKMLNVENVTQLKNNQNKNVMYYDEFENK